MPPAPRTTGVDHDQIFKSLIQAFFKEFVSLFLPHLVRHIDFRRVTFAHAEGFTDIPRGKRRALDLVVKVGVRGGGESFVIVHVEFESRRDPGFPERLGRYFSQLVLRHRRPVIPVAVFTDDAVWRKPMPTFHEMGFAGRIYQRFQYELVKLKNLSFRRFLKSHNPLAFALMAKMGYARRERVRLKAQFLRMILGSKVNPARRSLLVHFVDTYMPLLTREEESFKEIVAAKPEYQEVREMITTWQKEGLKRGRRLGRTEGKAEGKAEGRAEGACIGKIQLAQKILRRTVTPTDELTGKSLPELQQMAAELEAEIGR